MASLKDVKQLTQGLEDLVVGESAADQPLGFPSGIRGRP